MDPTDILDIVLKASIIGIGWLTVAILAKTLSSDTDRVRREYEARIRELREQVSEYRERIEEMKRLHREEIKKYMQVNKMLIELKKALDSGAVRIVCTRHGDSDVTLLADGTMICARGHRVWPPEAEGEEGGG